MEFAEVVVEEDFEVKYVLTEAAVVSSESFDEDDLSLQNMAIENV